MTSQDEDRSLGDPAESSDPNRANHNTRNRWDERAVQYLKEKLRQRRAAKQQETPQDKFSRRLVHATVAIAVLTGVIVIVGVLQYLSIEGQLSVMRDQLPVMEAESIIHGNEIVGRIKIDIDEQPMAGGWSITPSIKNVGKTEIHDFGSWHDFHIFETKDAAVKADLRKPLSKDVRTINDTINLGPTDGRHLFSKVVTIQDAEGMLQGKAGVL